MADNVTLNSGSGGATLATDDIAGVQHQRVKIQYGVDGSATDVSDTNPLPIDDAGGSITVDGTVTADAGTGPWPVTDNGGSLTVDGSVTVSGTVTANAGTNLNTSALALESGGNLATLSALSKAEDAAHNSGDTGIQALAVRNDSDTSLCGTTGDYTPLQVDSSGYLKVNIKAGAGSGGTASTDDAAFTAGSGSGTPIMGFATSDTVDAGDVGVLAMDTARNLKVSIEADNVGIGGGTQYTEDDAAAANPVGTMGMAVRADSLGAVTSTNGDNIALRATNNGELYVKQTDAVPVTDNGATLSVDDGGGAITVDNAGTFAVQVSSAIPAGTNNIGDVDVVTVPAPLNVIGGGTEASALRVTIANNSTGLVSVDDGGGSITVDSASLTTIAGAVSGSEMQVDVVGALPAGTNNIGDVDVLSIAAGTNVIGDVGISGARTSGGTTLYKNIDVDESEDQVKGTGGQVYWIAAYNLSSAVKYLKFYNATAATVTVGTTTPDLTFPIPTQGDTNGAGFVLSIPNGIAFSTAITIAATTGIGDADSGAPGANEVVVMLGYA